MTSTTPDVSVVVISFNDAAGADDEVSANAVQKTPVAPPSVPLEKLAAEASNGT